MMVKLMSTTTLTPSIFINLNRTGKVTTFGPSYSIHSQFHLTTTICCLHWVNGLQIVTASEALGTNIIIIHHIKSSSGRFNLKIGKSTMYLEPDLSQVMTLHPFNQRKCQYQLESPNMKMDIYMLWSHQHHHPRYQQQQKLSPHGPICGRTRTMG